MLSKMPLQQLLLLTNYDAIIVRGQGYLVRFFLKGATLSPAEKCWLSTPRPNSSLLCFISIKIPRMKEITHNHNDITEAAKQRLFVAKQFETTTQQQLKFANVALERAQFRVRDTQEVHKMAKRSLEEAVKFAEMVERRCKEEEEEEEDEEQEENLAYNPTEAFDFDSSNNKRTSDQQSIQQNKRRGLITNNIGSNSFGAITMVKEEDDDEKKVVGFVNMPTYIDGDTLSSEQQQQQHGKKDEGVSHTYDFL